MKDFFYKYDQRDDLISIRTDAESFTYKKLFNLSEKLSSAFDSKVNTQQKYIPILSSNSPEFVIITLALWNLGLTPVPLNTKWTESEISSVINKYKFDILIYEEKFVDKLSSLQIRKISFTELFDTESKSYSKKDNDEAVVIFTSGSSAQPKGVIHTFDSLSNSIINGSTLLNQKVCDRWLASLPFYHIGGFQIICRALSNGCEIIIPNDLQIISLSNAIGKFKPTHLSLVPTQLKQLLEESTPAPNELKLCLVGGGFSNDSLIIDAADKGWKPVRVYGSTETASFVTSADVETIKKKSDTAGKAVENVEIKISSEDEIIISSSSLFKSYLKDDKATNDKLRNNLYFSGDLGMLDEEGYLFFEARRTDLIVSGGENVNPFEVESALLKIESISEACVFPIQDEKWGQIVAAALVVKKNIDEEVIKSELKKNLAAFKIPKKFFFVDKLPKTSLGKIEREKVREMFN
ncbi:o-succinylbenzoate--CoA ligase [Ignavibacterium sp.]|uniref:o-succinylbenzoate--CoA ligase n=1 Tax=Ignavibacterium sp. TaxID=2651167 RepID=UPI00307D8232